MVCQTVGAAFQPARGAGVQAKHRPSTLTDCGPLARGLLLSVTLVIAGCAGPAPTPIADRPINLEGHCEQRESDGFREQARVSVRANQVQQLSWRLWVGSRGTCQFELTDFRQTRSGPHIELAALDGSGCRLLIWQDTRRVTLGHAGCASRCTGGILEEAWPVMFDPLSGACARTAS